MKEETNQYRRANAINRVQGYYEPPNLTNRRNMTVPECFEMAKQEALKFMRRDLQDVENLTVFECFPKFGERLLEELQELRKQGNNNL